MQPSSLIIFHLNPDEVIPNLHNLVMYFTKHFHFYSVMIITVNHGLNHPHIYFATSAKVTNGLWRSLNLEENVHIAYMIMMTCHEYNVPVGFNSWLGRWQNRIICVDDIAPRAGTSVQAAKANGPESGSWFAVSTTSYRGSKLRHVRFKNLIIAPKLFLFPSTF
jgi:hypothetical protein